MNPLLLPKLLGWIAKVPWYAWVIAALLAWGGVHKHRAAAAKAEFQAAQVKAREEQAEQKAKDDAQSARRTKVIMEAADAANLKAQTARDDAVRARSTLDRVLNTLVAHPPDSGASSAAIAASSAPATDTGSVPAELLRRCGAQYLEMAAIADQRGTPGATCERSYDSLNQSKEIPK